MQTVKIGGYNKEGEWVERNDRIVSHGEISTPNQGKQQPQGKDNKVAKPKKKASLGKILLIVLAILTIGVLGFAALRWKALQDRVKNSSGNNSVTTTCSNLLDPSCWTEAFRPHLKQDNGFTNMLIVGLDTRESGKGSSLMNTDTIMVASYNHTTKQAMLISIPRDFWVSFKINGKGPFSMKINSVYATGEVRDDVDDGMVLLEQVVSEIIGQPIHYRTVVKLQAVEDIVNTFDGIDITIDKAFAAQYPNDNPTPQNPSQWLRYEFPAGVNHLNGEKALVYARFRHIYKGDENLASDFSRGERQQEVIDALKDKALSEDLSLKDRAQKYWDILQTLKKNVEINLSFEDLLAGLDLVDEANLEPIKIVFDPNFGGAGKLIYHPPTDSTRGYVIEPRDKTYKALQDELALAWKYGSLYNEQAHLLVANKTGKAYPAGHKALALKNDEAPLGIITYLTQTKTELTGIRIYDFSGGKNPETINFLKKYFGVENVSDQAADGVTQSTYKEDIVIVVGPDAPPATEPQQ